MAEWYAPLTLLNIASLYQVSELFWDGLIYLLIFLGLATFVFSNKQQFGKKRGRPIAIGVGLALTLAMIMWESRSGFRLGGPEMGVLSLTIFAIIVFFLFYRVFHVLFGMESPMCSVSLSFILIYGGLFSMYAKIMDTSASTYPLIHMLLSLMVLISVILLAICVGKLFSGMGGGGNGGNKNYFVPTDDNGNPLHSSKSGGKDGATGSGEPTTKNPPLTLNIESPPPGGDKYNKGEDIPIKGAIQGGGDDVAWQVLVNPKIFSSTSALAGRGRDIAGMLKSIGAPGEHTIRFRAWDHKDKVELDRTIVISDTAFGRIAGELHDSAGNPHQYDPANTYEVVATHPNGTAVASATVGTVGTSPTAKFAIDKLPDGEYIIKAVVKVPGGSDLTGVNAKPSGNIVLSPSNRIHDNIVVEVQGDELVINILTPAKEIDKRARKSSSHRDLDAEVHNVVGTKVDVYGTLSDTKNNSFEIKRQTLPVTGGVAPWKLLIPSIDSTGLEPGPIYIDLFAEEGTRKTHTRLTITYKAPEAENNEGFAVEIDSPAPGTQVKNGAIFVINVKIKGGKPPYLVEVRYTDLSGTHTLSGGSGPTKVFSIPCPPAFDIGTAAGMHIGFQAFAQDNKGDVVSSSQVTYTILKP